MLVEVLASKAVRKNRQPGINDGLGYEKKVAQKVLCTAGRAIRTEGSTVLAYIRPWIRVIVPAT